MNNPKCDSICISMWRFSWIKIDCIICVTCHIGYLVNVVNCLLKCFQLEV